MVWVLRVFNGVCSVVLRYGGVCDSTLHTPYTLCCCLRYLLYIDCYRPRFEAHKSHTNSTHNGVHKDAESLVARVYLFIYVKYYAGYFRAFGSLLYKDHTCDSNILQIGN